MCIIKKYNRSHHDHCLCSSSDGSLILSVLLIIFLNFSVSRVQWEKLIWLQKWLLTKVKRKSCLVYRKMAWDTGEYTCIKTMTQSIGMCLCWSMHYLSGTDNLSPPRHNKLTNKQTKNVYFCNSHLKQNFGEEISQPQFLVKAKLLS